MGYLGDLGAISPLPLTKEAHLAFIGLSEISGFELTLSKSEWGFAPRVLRPRDGPYPFSGSPPFLYPPQAKTDELKAQTGGRASPATPQKLVGKPSVAQISAMGRTVRGVLPPSYLQSNSDVASRALSPSAGGALGWRFQAISGWGPRVVQPIRPSPALILCTDPRGPVGCSAFVFQAQGKDEGAPPYKSIVPLDDRAPADGTNLIFALELFAVASASWSLEGSASGASIVIYAGNDDVAQLLRKGGSNRSLIDHIVWAIWFPTVRESLIVWLRRASSSSNPADAPSRDGHLPVKISTQRAPPPLRRPIDLFPPLNLDSPVWQEENL